MLNETINNILFEIKEGKNAIEKENVTKEKACEYLELCKLEDDFKKYLEAIKNKKEEKGKEEKND